MMNEINNIVAAERAKLNILLALKEEASYSSNEQLLQAWLDATGGVPVARAFVRQCMLELEELKAVKIKVAGELMIATITESGLEHVEGRAIIKGVLRPEVR